MEAVIWVRTYEINQTYDFGGYDILINRIEISPLSYKIYADYESAMRVEEDEKIHLRMRG